MLAINPAIRLEEYACCMHLVGAYMASVWHVQSSLSEPLWDPQNVRPLEPNPCFTLYRAYHRCFPCASLAQPSYCLQLTSHVYPPADTRFLPEVERRPA